MIKKLRVKFIAASMLALALVLLVILGGINAMSYRKTVSDADAIFSILASFMARSNLSRRFSARNGFNASSSASFSSFFCPALESSRVMFRSIPGSSPSRDGTDGAGAGGAGSLSPPPMRCFAMSAIFPSCSGSFRMLFSRSSNSLIRPTPFSDPGLLLHGLLQLLCQSLALAGAEHLQQNAPEGLGVAAFCRLLHLFRVQLLRQTLTVGRIGDLPDGIGLTGLHQLPLHALKVFHHALHPRFANHSTVYAPPGVK